MIMVLVSLSGVFIGFITQKMHLIEASHIVSDRDLPIILPLLDKTNSSCSKKYTGNRIQVEGMTSCFVVKLTHLEGFSPQVSTYLNWKGFLNPTCYPATVV